MSNYNYYDDYITRSPTKSDPVSDDAKSAKSVEQFKQDAELSKQIVSLGLILEPVTDSFKRQDPIYRNRLFEFKRSPTETVPALEIVVNRSEFGYHVIVNATEYDPGYHRDTGSPIIREKVVEQIKTYLSEVTGQTF